MWFPSSARQAAGLLCAARPGLPHVDTAGSIRRQQPHRREQLGPSVEMSVPRGNGFGGEILHSSFERQEWKEHERNSCAETKVSEEDEGGGAPCARGVFPLCPMEDPIRTDTHTAAQVDLTLQQVDMSSRKLLPLESPCLSKRLAENGGHPHWSSLLLKDCTLVERPRAAAVVEELQPFFKGPPLEQSCRTSSPGRDPMLAQGKSMMKEQQEQC